MNRISKEKQFILKYYDNSCKLLIILSATISLGCLLLFIADFKLTYIKNYRLLFLISHFILFFTFSFDLVVIVKSKIKHKINPRLYYYLYATDFIGNIVTLLISILEIKISIYPIAIIIFLVCSSTFLIINPKIALTLALIDYLIIIYSEITFGTGVHHIFTINLSIVFLCIFLTQLQNYISYKRYYQHEKELLNISYLDSLTYVGNRRSLNNKLSEICQIKKEYYILMVKMYPVKWTLNKKMFYSLGFLMR